MHGDRDREIVAGRMDAEHLAQILEVLAGPEPRVALEQAQARLRPLGIERNSESARPQLIVPPEVEPALARALRAAFRLAARRLEDHETREQAQERAKMLSEASFEGLFIHIDGTVIDVNARLAEIVRTAEDELLGPETLFRCVDPDDLPTVLEHMRSGTDGAYVIHGVRFDGTRFRAELQSKQGKLGERPVRVVAVRDVTERERMVELLRESETRLRDLVETMFEVTVLSRDGVIIDTSGPIEALTGVRREDAIGRELLSFLSPSTVPRASQILAEQRTGPYEATIMSTTGEAIPIEIVGAYSTLDGQSIRIAGIRDLRERHSQESERRKLEQRVEQAERLNSLGVLAGGIAHDFNNLLVGILGNADLIQVSTEDPELLELSHAIIDAGEKAAALIAQMLAYAGRGEMGTPQPVDLGVLLHELRVLLAATLSKKATLVVDVDPHTVVRADRTTLTQLLLNLLTNASDALEGGAGEIAVQARRVTQPDARWDDALGANVGPGSWVQVDVRDDGVGMSEAVKSRIFEPFFSTKATGHGLGLAACLGIVSNMGGALRVTSRVGRGSTFALLLPADVASEDEAVPTIRDAASLASPKRVLVIDDEPIVRAQLQRSLSLRGCSVTEAENGRRGLELARAEPFDVIVLDLSMPELDGAEVLTRLRSHDVSTPVVLTSGYIDAAAEQRLERGSFQAFLRKPYGVPDLVQALDQAMAATSSAEDPAKPP